ncbi:MAG: YbaK/EbsC family protein [Anderseniella sp.]|nr:YbaK/EbsC family protein [Anderseniella sp.]
MGIALTLQEYLDDSHIAYEVTSHKKTDCSAQTAEVSHVPADQLAKGVIVKWDDFFVLAVLPASRRLDMNRLKKVIGEPVTLASEQEVSMLFPDCKTGAVPVIGPAYKIASVVDWQLDDQDEVYFEGGDHRCLVHVNGVQFDHLMYGIPHARLSA